MHICVNMWHIWRPLDCQHRFGSGQPIFIASIFNLRLQSYMLTLNIIFHVEAIPVEGSGSVLALLGNADSRLWVKMRCRGCRAPFSNCHRACLHSQANFACPEPQPGIAAFPGDFFLVFPFWLFIASSNTVSCQHLRPGFSLCRNSGECGTVMSRNSSALAPAQEYVQWISLLEKMGRPSHERWLEIHKTVSHRCLVRCWSLWCVGFPCLAMCHSVSIFFPFILFLSTVFPYKECSSYMTWSLISSSCSFMLRTCHVNSHCLGQMGWWATS